MPRNADIDALQQQRLLGFDFLEFPATALDAPVMLDAAVVGVDEDEVLQRGNAAVGGEGFAEHLFELVRLLGFPMQIVGGRKGLSGLGHDQGVGVRLITRLQDYRPPYEAF